jgi:hypothetical protein
MSRQESDRDDLFQEIRALSPRVEFQVLPGGEVVTAGSRAATGGWSIYFGADPVYHFDASGGLRRAYVDSQLYRTQGTTLARMNRQRTAEEVQLVRRDLSTMEVASFASAMRSRLNWLREAMQQGRAKLLRQEPSELAVANLLAEALDVVLSAEPILAPAIATRRH